MAPLSLYAQEDNRGYCPTAACQIDSGSSNNLGDTELNCVYSRPGLASSGSRTGNAGEDFSGNLYWGTTKTGSANCPVVDKPGSTPYRAFCDFSAYCQTPGDCCTFPANGLGGPHCLGRLRCVPWALSDHMMLLACLFLDLWILSMWALRAQQSIRYQS